MNEFKKNTVHFLLTLITLIFISLQATQNQAYASTDYGLGRTRSCNVLSGSPDGLHFDPSTGGKDVEFVLSNPVCISVITYTYAATKIAIAWMNSICRSGSAVPRITPSPFLDSIDLSKAVIKAATERNLSCVEGLVKASALFSTSIGALYGIYSVADYTFKSTKICGADWKGPNTKTFLYNNPNYKGALESKITEYIEDPAQRNKLNFDNKDYREWYYDGMEVSDDNTNDSENCYDVSQEKLPNDEYPTQKYYLKGYESGNYNCAKYDILPGQDDPRDGGIITDERREEYRKAYNCCARRAQNYVCIDYAGTKRFCRAGTKCEIKGIHFETKPRDNGSLICAQTYSLCPYNFFIGGGSEICDYYQDGTYNSSKGKFEFISLEDIKNNQCATKSDIRNTDCTYNEKAGKCRNYCQYMRHCTKTNSVYKYRSNLSSPYFSTACINFTGDSKNVVSYGTGFIAGSARHFSAPIAQCTKETLENVFHNRAGHTKCISESDIPNSKGDCKNGTAYKAGDQINSRSFFTILQDRLIFAIKMVIMMSIAFYGVKILLGGGQIKKSELLLYFVKLGLVIFFATGNAWQGFFFDGVYSASGTLSQMVFKLQMPDNENKRDGCQFGISNDSKGNPVANPVKYPYGKEYLSVWDSLDCKISRYMGFGPEVSDANIAKLIIAGIITGPIGIYLSIALFIFAFLLISATIRALHIFLASSIAILLMVYISPITITTALFSKSESIFKGWLKHLMGFVFQPIILFAYIAIFITILDKTLVGSATFYGQPPIKTLSCKKYCVDAQGNKVSAAASPECGRIGEQMINPRSDSFACLIDSKSFANWPGLEFIGIAIPFILEIFAEDAQKRILTLVKGVIIIYFLDKFMSEIPGITSQLIGGKGLSQSSISAQNLFKNTQGLLRGFQKRGARGGKKVLGAAGRKAMDTARYASGSKGKSVEGDSTPATGKASDAAESSSSSKPSSAESSGGGGGSSAEK